MPRRAIALREKRMEKIFSMGTCMPNAATKGLMRME